MSCTFMIGQCRCLSISLVAYIACIRFVVGMDDVVFIKTGILSKSFIAAMDLTDVGAFT